VSERRGTPDEGFVYPGSESWDSIYDLEKEIEGGSTRLRELLKEMLERIIEKKLEYYLPPPELEE
jgi:hypothetical protein